MNKLGQKIIMIKNICCIGADMLEDQLWQSIAANVPI